MAIAWLSSSAGKAHGSPLPWTDTPVNDSTSTKVISRVLVGLSTSSLAQGSKGVRRATLARRHGRLAASRCSRLAASRNVAAPRATPTPESSRAQRACATPTRARTRPPILHTLLSRCPPPHARGLQPKCYNKCRNVTFRPKCLNPVLVKALRETTNIPLFLANLQDRGAYISKSRNSQKPQKSSKASKGGNRRPELKKLKSKG